MVTPTDSGTVQCEVRVAAQPETVFSYFTDPVKMVRWQGIGAVLDPQPGGAYRVELGPGIVMLGEYQEVTPYSRIVFSFGWEGDEAVAPGSTTVEITLAQEGTDTVVRLRHSGLPSAEAAANHGGGWDHYLARLAIAGAGGGPGPHTLPGAPS